jgi:ribosome production factor 1
VHWICIDGSDRQERLAKNIPITLDNTRIYDSSSYLTADPKALQAAAERAAEASRRLNEEKAIVDEEDESGEEEEESDEEDDDEDEEMPEAGPSTERLPTQPSAEADASEAAEEQPAPPAPTGPPRILITTSPSPCKETYAFCDDLKNIFPGGEFFKRPKGRGFELGRISRWAAKRQYHALIVVNEDHKTPSKLSGLFGRPS